MNISKWAAYPALLVVLTACNTGGSGSATATPGAIPQGDWPSYNRDLAGTRFSPLLPHKPPPKVWRS